MIFISLIDAENDEMLINVDDISNVLVETNTNNELKSVIYFRSVENGTRYSRETVEEIRKKIKEATAGVNPKRPNWM